MTDPRYHRQTLLPQIAPAGQQRLGQARVLLVGCGALGTVIAEQLVRAGVGMLRICDRDIVETTNLQRQVLFDESDAENELPKAIAAANRLKRINSTITIESVVVDVHGGNIDELAEGVDLILDGTDNAETRYLINDLAIKRSIPWVYGACVGTTGRAMGIIPETTACLRCLFPDPPEPGQLATCDTAGVLAAAAGVVASIQVVEAMKILFGDPSAGTELTTIELWPLRVRTITTADARREECPACGRHEFEFLNARPGASAISLCGRDTIQIRPATNGTVINLDTLAERLAAVGDVQRRPFFVRCALRDQPLCLTLFPDGRAMIHGTDDPALARSVYARVVGN